MSYKATPGLTVLMLTAAKTALDAGFLFAFAGAEPAEAGDALDMVATHTQVAKLTVAADGITGLTFDAAVAAVLAKAAPEDWSGVITLDGFDAGPTVTPTFWRFCPAGDTGRTAVTTPRLQGTIGGPSSNADLKLGADTVTDNGTNAIGAGVFNLRLSSLG